MMDFTAHWHWPQWTFVSILLIGLIMSAAQHGDDKVYSAGPGKGNPVKYNGFIALIKFAVIIAILVCGGFFS